MIAEAQLLRGMALLTPGAITRLGAGGEQVERLWTPRDFCAAGQGDPEILAGMIDDCLSAWGSIGGPAMLELSGGLDSAIVAASARQAGLSIARAVTVFSDRLSGDERRFSRAIADHLGLPSQEIALMPLPLDMAMLTGKTWGTRPGIGASSLFHDDRLADAGRALGARLLITGRGGDALFFQHPTAAVAADRWPRHLRKGPGAFEALARWTQASVWQVAAHAWVPGRHRGTPPEAASRFSTFRGSRRPAYWAGPLDGLTPAKALQVMAIAGDRSAFGPSQCGSAMRMVHPLLSQPLVEYALGQSIMALTDGRRDRALARAAFADRLPASILERHGKGALGGYFGRVLAMSTGALRETLLEGTLSKAGLLDRAALEQALDPEYLMQEDCYGALLGLVLVERWTRDWQDRLRQGAS